MFSCYVDEWLRKSVSTWVGGGNGGEKKLGGKHEINRFADSTKCQLLKSMQCNNCLNRSSSVPVLNAK